MNTLVVPIDSSGVLIVVTIGLSAADTRKFRQQGKPLPASVTVEALIDTGAEASAVDPAVLAPLVSATPMPEYSVSLTIGPSAGLLLRNFAVIEQPLRSLGYQAVIGRDVRMQCLLVYDGPNQRVTLGV